jgi:hypothetical protein
VVEEGSHREQGGGGQQVQHHGPREVLHVVQREVPVGVPRDVRHGAINNNVPNSYEKQETHHIDAVCIVVQIGKSIFVY